MLTAAPIVASVQTVSGSVYKLDSEGSLWQQGSSALLRLGGGGVSIGNDASGQLVEMDVNHTLWAVNAGGAWQVIGGGPGASAYGSTFVVASSDASIYQSTGKQPTATSHATDIVAVAIGAGTLWCQFGVINAEGARIAEDGGVTVIMDRCLKVEHARYVGRMHWLGFNTQRITSVRSGLQ